MVRELSQREPESLGLESSPTLRLSQLLTASSAGISLDLEFEAWKERDAETNLYMRDFHYTKAVSGAGPKEVVCLGEYFPFLDSSYSSYIFLTAVPRTKNLLRTRREQASR